MYMSRANTPQRSRANTMTTSDLQQISNLVLEDDLMIIPNGMDIIEPIPEGDIISPIPEMVIMDFENELMDITPDLLNNISPNKSSQHTRASSVKDGNGASSFIHNSDGSVFVKIELPSGLPRSELLNIKNTFTERLYHLYLKYIKVGSVHEINVSYYQRARITEAMKNMVMAGIIDIGENNTDGRTSNLPQFEIFSVTSDDGDDVQAISPKSVENNVPNNGIHLDIAGYGQFNVMDGACIEILMLMVDSYKRFRINMGK